MNKDNNTKLVPELRFPEFKNAGEWEDIKFGELCKFTRGPFGGALKKEIFTKDGYAVYEQSHAIYEKFDSFRYYITVDKFNELKRFAVLPNDIIMSCSGTMGKFAIVPNDSKQGVINQALLKLTVLKGSDLKFIKMTLELPLNQEKLLSQSAGGAIKNVVSVDQIKEINLYIPKLAEQKKIADCLSSLDELIAANIEKLDALKSHKKGLMQRLFPAEGETIPQLRFPEFKNDREWEEVILGEVGTFIGGGTPDTSKMDYWNGNIQWFTPSEIKGKYNKKSIRTISENGLQNSSAKLLPKGALLITTRATIGEIAIAIEQCTTNQGFQSLVVNDSEINMFWYYWIIQNKNILMRKSSGSTFPEIGKNEISKIKAFKPKKFEQQKIADCLSSLDELIEAISQKIEALKQHKKGLMQGLFPKNIE